MNDTNINIPFYELYFANIDNPSILDIILYKLYKYNRFNIFNKLIYKLEKIKYKNYQLIDNKKIIQDIDISNKNILVKTSTGYNKISHIYRTKPFIIYKLILVNGLELKCADTHKVYTKSGWKYVKDLLTTDFVQTDIDNYVQVYIVIKTNDTQFLGDVTIYSKEHDLYTNNILSKNTTSTCSFFLWYLCFHADRNLLITANKEKTTKEILSKLLEMMKGLPYFLKPGIEEYSKVSLRIENGCSIRAVATTGDSATGDSINILLIDECALIAQNVLTEFWSSVYPTLTSFKQSQIIVLSTPRGRQGLFYELWDGAQKGTNGFVSKRVDWWQVPGRDEKWKQEQLQVFGEDLWAREFELSFDTNESRLLSKTVLEYIDSIKKKFVHFDIYGVPKRVTDKIYWDPDFHPDELSYDDKIRRRFICIIDTAEGTEKGEYGKEDADYNIINIFEMKLMDPELILKNRLGYKAVKYTNCIQLEQVGIYIDNNFDEEECAAAAQHIAFDIFSNGGGYSGEIDNMRILFETNFNGKNFKKTFAKHDQYYESIIKGFLTTGGNHGKKYYCELGAKLMELHQIIVKQDHDIPVMSTVEQLKSFGKVKNSYAGLAMHDDISITVLFASRFFDDENQFEWLDEWFSQLPNYSYENQEQRENVMTILNYLQIYEYTKEDEDDNNLADIASYAAQGFGKITQQTTGTYGSLMNLSTNQQQYPYNQLPYYQPNYMNQGTYSSLKNNNVMNSRFIKR